MLFDCHPNILRKYFLQFLLGVKMTPREAENSAYAKFWGDKQGALWHVVVFSAVVSWVIYIGMRVVWTEGRSVWWAYGHVITKNFSDKWIMAIRYSAMKYSAKSLTFSSPFRFSKLIFR